MTLAYCGFDCRECPVYAATLAWDESLRPEVAKKYPKMALDYIRCRGCGGDIPESRVDESVLRILRVKFGER